MSDRERAREIVERLAYDEELDRNGQEALIATALAQARAEGLRQAAEVVEGMSRNPVYGTEPSASVLVASGHVAARLRARAEPGK